MQRAEEWLENQGKGGFQVFGQLIGTKPSPKSNAQGAVVLRRRVKEAGPQTSWKVRDYLDVFIDTQAAHEELLEIHKKLEEADEDNGNNTN